MNETWVHYYEPEGKQQSSVWETAHSPTPVKAEAVKSIGKVMLMVFMDNQGVILFHSVKPGSTVNSAYYSKVVGRDLIRVIRKKRPVVRTDIKNVIYPHDNAPAHTAAATDLEIALLGFQRLSHPPYSPDLAPLDFAYFPMLKSSLRGHRFDNMVDILHSVQVFNISLRRQWFENVFKQWVRRHEECVEHSGRYFESCDYVTLQVRGDVNLTLTFSGPRGYT